MSAIGLEHADVRQNRLLALLRQQPLICYFVIAYAFTWTYDLLFLVLFPLPDVLGRSAPRDLGPSVAAIIMTAAVAGKPGLKRLGQRLVLWRVNVGWYLVVALGVPAIYLLSILLIPGALASFTTPAPGRWLLYPVFFLVIMVLGGPLFEEPGWRGFALPRLQARWGPLAGAVILGLLWAGWHATEYLTPDFASANGGLTVKGISIFVLAAVSFSVIITWVFNHTQASLLIAILLHTFINWSQGLTSDLFPAAGFNETGPVVAFVLTALVIVMATRGRLGYVRPGDDAGRVSGAVVGQ
jgi:membrane protease YdiL (CAAX protease family)